MVALTVSRVWGVRKHKCHTSLEDCQPRKKNPNRRPGSGIPEDTREELTTSEVGREASLGLILLNQLGGWQLSPRWTPQAQGQPCSRSPKVLFLSDILAVHRSKVFNIMPLLCKPV